jgi:hypothetical protein
VDALKIDPSKPYVYFTVSHLWPEVSIDVYALSEPPVGEADPGLQLLVTLEKNGATKKGLKLPTQKAADGTVSLDCIGLRFATTADPDNTGTVEIEIRREQDKPAKQLVTNWPSAGTISLARQNADAPIYVEQEIAVEADKP